MSQDAASVAAIVEDPGGTIGSDAMPAFPHLDQETRLELGRYVESLSR
jgi:hypothetical protein